MEKYNFKDNSDLKNNTAENLFDDSRPPGLLRPPTAPA